MSYECHITLRAADATVGAEVARFLNWKTSEIARDPLLGDDTFFYLTQHHPTVEPLMGSMQRAVGDLVGEGVLPLRIKIEHIVFDTKTGVRLPTKPQEL